MIYRSIAALAVAGSMLIPAVSSASENNANISQGKGPMVHVTLKNMSNLTQNLVIQGRPFVLEANESTKIEVPAGTPVYGADNTVKLTIVKDYNGAVASFR